MKKFLCLVSLFASIFLFAQEEAAPKFRFELEGGAVWQTRNEVQIPNNATSTRFKINPLKPDAGLTGRASFFWNMGERHALKALVAPLSLSGEGTFSNAVSFQGATFAANTPTIASYKFHSYRLTYRYHWLQGEKWNFKIGATAKIRNARIALQQGALLAEKTDLGFVPLLHFNLSYRFADTWRIELDGDALAAPQGRAEDVSLFLWGEFSPQVEFGAGYRTLEGGADNPQVFTFAWLHYFSALVAFKF